MPIQQMLLGAGSAVAAKKYLDDVFSTYVYEGDGTTSHQIVNGIDLASKGGLIWGKERGNTGSHYLFDTERGLNKRLKSNSDSAEETDTFYSSVNSNGYTISKTTSVNVDGNDYVSWSFAKSPGFFDVVTWDGNNAAGRQIAHNLGCVPGCIIVKSYVDSDPRPWRVYHRGVDATAPEDYALRLDGTDARSDNSAFWNDTAPTSSVFTVGNHASTNMSNISYVAYVFAGGSANSQDLARSVDFDRSGDYLSVGSSSDFNMGTGDFTVECWVKFDTDDDAGSGTDDGIFQISDTSGGLNSTGTATTHTIGLSHNAGNAGGVFNIFGAGSWPNTASFVRKKGQWYHVAYVRASGTRKLYVDGTQIFSQSDTQNYNGTHIAIGGYYSTTYLLDGHISNFRVVKGTAVYTSNFNPTDSLTNITNTKLLCCNNSSTTGSTVIPSGLSITANGDPTASTDSPLFEDPAGYVFGESGSESVISTGSYIGNGSTDGPEIFLGWEPQWLMIKRTNSTGNWQMYDSMRGIVTGGNEARLNPNNSNAEAESEKIDLTPTGFKVTTSDGETNASGSPIIYIAIRRPDGYVGKLMSLGSDCFAMDTGNSSSTIPCFDSGFVVDYALSKQPAQTQYWQSTSRLTGTGNLETNQARAEEAYGAYVWDSNVGAHYGRDSNWQAWMWKRHAGFDVVTYKGDGVAGRQIPHSLNKTIEMIWVKDRSSSNGWAVGHKGLNGGTNPWKYNLKLNENAAEESYTNRWNDTAPTSTHFTVGTSNRVNTDGDDYIAMLFASVDGISKVGSFSGSSSNVTVTTGFAPRFLIIKRADSGSSNWYVFDSLRGLGASGNDGRLYLDTNVAQWSGGDWVNTSATGFVANSGMDQAFNWAGGKFIYYAHA